MLIRKAVETDVPLIHKLQQSWFEEGNVYGFAPESKKQIEAALDSYLVAEIGQRVVGFISSSVRISEGTSVIPAGESYLEIENLYVLPEFRNQGVGSSLTARQLSEAKALGAKYALVYSAAREIRHILDFYERHNFKSWYVQMFQKL